MQLRSIKQAPLANKRVLLLVDYDAPPGDDTRIRLTLPTIEYLRAKGAKIIIVTKRGRPDGHVVDTLRVDICAQHLEKLLKVTVTKIDTTIGPRAEAAVSKLKPKQILMLENSRFLPGENNNDPKTAKALSKLADVVVNDAFSLDHRAQASNSAISRYLPVYAGLHLLLEVKMLTTFMTHPVRPFVAIIGGAKISDKLAAIENMAKIADVVLVGGGVANNFLKATGVDVAKSYLEDVAVDKHKQSINYVHLAQDLLEDNHKKIQYPVDVVAAHDPEHPRTTCTLNLVDPSQSDCPDDNLMFLDIGPATMRLYVAIIKQAKTVFWNGPMGVYEKDQFAEGTKAIAQAVARNRQAVTVLGGGDTGAAIAQFGFTHKYDYVSAAGGAALEFLGGKVLPGLKPMMVK